MCEPMRTNGRENHPEWSKREGGGGGFVSREWGTTREVGEWERGRQEGMEDHQVGRREGKGSSVGNGGPPRRLESEGGR
jgi:hypothetical protein